MAHLWLTEKLAGETPAFEERVVSNDMSEDGAHISSRRFASDDESFTKIGFEEGRVGCGLKYCQQPSP